MKNVIVTEASWSGDEKSVNFSIYDDKDVRNNPQFLGVKENIDRLSVEVGQDNWDDENEDNCKMIIQKFLNEKGLNFTNDFSIN